MSKFYVSTIKNLKKLGHFCWVNFKGETLGAFLFFRFLTRCYPRLKFVSNTFLTKIPKNSHCALLNAEDHFTFN